MKRMCSSMQMDCVRLVEIVHLNSGLSAGFIVSVGDSLGFFIGGEKPTRIRSVPECLTLVVECWDVCRIAHHALVSNYS